MNMKALAKPQTGGILLLAVVIAILPMFLPNSFYFDVVILVGINAIVCVGLNLLIGYAGQIVLGMPDFLPSVPIFPAFWSATMAGHQLLPCWRGRCLSALCPLFWPARS